MLKTTQREIRRESSFEGIQSVLQYMKDNNLKQVDRVEKVAYCVGVYGCNGYLLSINLVNEHGIKHTIKAFTGNSTWMYACENTNYLNEQLSKI